MSDDREKLPIAQAAVYDGMLTDEQIIAIRKASYTRDTAPWSDTIAFADALLTAIGQPRKK